MINNDLINQIKSRRSVRKWKREKVPKELIDKITDCGRRAPSSYGAEPWELIVVDEEKTIEKLLSNRRQLKQPPYFINSSKYVDKSSKNKYGQVDPPPLMIIVAGDKKRCYDDLTGLIASLACCTENMLLASHALGLGACWLFVKDETMPEIEKEVKTVLGVPDGYVVLCLLAIGYPDEIPLKKTRKISKIHHNAW
ncbi:MAG: nitroreductase family protein [Patescibacteria group bacterium]|nr:nitroreductase family protein [Patescibacteria group bacterium]